ncbi:MAG: hypothetical protein K2I07_01830 [Lachnospiraceae bacterium]|nr:hypothetical protein [Lachnospiraceae bacterium]
MESSSFFNSKDGDRVYNAGDWADYFRPLFQTGVFNGDLQVVANGGMSVKVQTGYAWIDGYKYRIKDEPLTLDMETASGNMNRIDNIVIRLDLPNRLIKSYVVSGNYYQGTATPKMPEISATIHEIVIARITVDAGTTEITQDLIEDTRMDGDLCGWVCGAVDQIKFEQIKAQFDAFFAKYRASILTEYESYTDAITSYEEQQKEDFEAWVNSLKNILDDADVARLQSEIDQTGSRIDVMESALDETLKNSDLIESLAITEPGKVMDGRTCSEYLVKALGTTLTGTLLAGKTMLTFTSAAITDDSMIHVYTDQYGVSPSAMVYSDGRLTLTFDAQSADIQVKVRVI